MIVFLIGMPACGKSSMGRRLAKKRRFNFVDLDSYLSTKENRSIATIFSKEGETFFRELETKYLKEISARTTNTIISLGGGTPCYHNNMQFLLSTGKVIYLNTSVDTLFLRLKNDTKRPLFMGLSGEEIKNKIILLLQQRESFYLRAHYKIDMAYKSDDIIIEEINSIINSGN